MIVLFKMVDYSIEVFNNNDSEETTTTTSTLSYYSSTGDDDGNMVWTIISITWGITKFLQDYVAPEIKEGGNKPTKTSDIYRYTINSLEA